MNNMPYAGAPLRAVPLSLLTLLVAMGHTNAEAQTLETVTVEGAAVDTDSATKPYELIDNKGIFTSSGSNLGERLNATTGISQSRFTAGASRPVIRGQEAERVKILQNSSASIDASSVSPDHALPIDPINLYQLELTRGPASLAYGGGAVAGVINVVDDLIARQATPTLMGEVNTEIAGPANTKALGFKLYGPSHNGWNVRFNMFSREEGDLNTPAFTDPNGERRSSIANSSLSAKGAGFGLSRTHESGYLGVSAQLYESNYGVPQTDPAESIRIGMKSERFAFEGEQALTGWIEKLRWRLSSTDYSHQELEDGEPATRFSNQGETGRIEAFMPIGQIGMQLENSDFKAIGDEAFVPASQTETAGLYYLGQTEFGRLSLDYGIRFDQTTVKANETGGNAPLGTIDPEIGFTGPAIKRDFDANAASLGLTWRATSTWELSANISHTERAPSSTELFADGLHVATAAYEKGNPNLTLEKSRHVELSTSFRPNHGLLKATMFTSRYSNYIGLFRTQGPNGLVNIDGDNFPVFTFEQVGATFYGLELEARRQIALDGNWRVEPTVQLDWVRGKRRDTDEFLPRQTPLRLTLTPIVQYRDWTITPSIQHVARSKPGDAETQTASYTLLNLGVSKDIVLDGAAGTVFVRLENLTDELAFSANTIETVRYFTPLAGRSVKLGLKLLF